MSATAKEEKPGPAVAGWGKRSLLSPAELPINDEFLVEGDPLDLVRVPTITLAVIYDRILGGVRQRGFGHATPLSYFLQGHFGEWAVEPEGYPQKHKGRRGRFVVREKKDPVDSETEIRGYAYRSGYQGPLLVFATEGEAVEWVVREHRRRYEEDRSLAVKVSRRQIADKIRDLRGQLSLLEHKDKAYQFLQEPDLSVEPIHEGMRVVWHMAKAPEAIQIVEAREVKADQFTKAENKIQ